MRYDSGDAVDRILDPETALRILEQQKREATEETPPQPQEAEAEEQVPPTSQEAIEVGVSEVRPGQIIRGRVVQASQSGVLVDVGLKYEGVIPAYEFPSPSEVPAVGAEVDVAIVRVNDEEGNVVLSKKRADYENVWRRILEAHKTGEVLTAMVTERVKGGLRVDLGVQGFVPASQVGVRRLRDLDRMVGRSLRLRVTEADKDQKKVILSHRMVIEEERLQRREETLQRLVEGGVFKGRVRNLTDYGAFVDLGGVDGLLHVSEMSWTRIKHPSEVLNVGETIEVIVLKIDQERNRISLGRKQILADPWKEAAKALRVGEVVKGRVTRVVPFGAFVQLENGIEGIVPNAELSERRGVEAKDVVSAGDTINVKILNIRPEERRMTLSLLQAQQEQDRKEYQEYMRTQRAQRPTLGDLYGDALQQHRAALEEAANNAAQEQAEAVAVEAASDPPQVVEAEPPGEPEAAAEEAPEAEPPAEPEAAADEAPEAEPPAEPEASADEAPEAEPPAEPEAAADEAPEAGDASATEQDTATASATE